MKSRLTSVRGEKGPSSLLASQRSCMGQEYNSGLEQYGREVG